MRKALLQLESSQKALIASKANESALVTPLIEESTTSRDLKLLEFNLQTQINQLSANVASSLNSIVIPNYGESFTNLQNSLLQLQGSQTDVKTKQLQIEHTLTLALENNAAISNRLASTETTSHAASQRLLAMENARLQLESQLHIIQQQRQIEAPAQIPLISHPSSTAIVSFFDGDDEVIDDATNQAVRSARDTIDANPLLATDPEDNRRFLEAQGINNTSSAQPEDFNDDFLIRGREWLAARHTVNNLSQVATTEVERNDAVLDMRRNQLAVLEARTLPLVLYVDDPPQLGYTDDTPAWEAYRGVVQYTGGETSMVPYDENLSEGFASPLDILRRAENTQISQTLCASAMTQLVTSIMNENKKFVDESMGAEYRQTQKNMRKEAKSRNLRKQRTNEQAAMAQEQKKASEYLASEKAKLPDEPIIRDEDEELEELDWTQSEPRPNTREWTRWFEQLDERKKTIIRERNEKRNTIWEAQRKEKDAAGKDKESTRSGAAKPQRKERINLVNEKEQGKAAKEKGQERLVERKANAAFVQEPEEVAMQRKKIELLDAQIRRLNADPKMTGNLTDMWKKRGAFNDARGNRGAGASNQEWKEIQKFRVKTRAQISKLEKQKRAVREKEIKI